MLVHRTNLASIWSVLSLFCRGTFSLPTFGLARGAAQLLPMLTGVASACAVRVTTSVFGGTGSAALEQGVPAWSVSVMLVLAFTLVNLKPLTLRGKWHVARWTA